MNNLTINVTNIGPIKSGTIELHPLTIVAGPNNSGKTYLTYAIFGLLTRHDEYTSSLSNSELGKRLFGGDVSSVSFDELESNINGVVSGYEKYFSKNLRDVFSAPGEEFEGAKIELSPKAIAMRPQLDTQGYQLRITRNRKVDLEVNGESKTVSLNFSPLDEGVQRDVPFLHEFIGSAISKSILNSVFPRVFISCAERLGISLFYKELDARRNVLVEHLQASSSDGKDAKFDPFEFIRKASSRYASPVKYNIDFTRDIESVQKEKGSVFSKYKLDSELKDILSGYFKHDKSGIRFVSKARRKGKFDIPIHLASASARSLSDFYFYLRHVAAEGDLIMIDEPESHLSQSNQVLLARLIAICVNCGLKVYFTTHSDFIVKEINNLIMLGNLRDKAQYTSDSFGYTERSFLNQDDVGAYVCDSGKISKCEIDEFGIELPSFDTAIEKINEVSSEFEFQLSLLKEKNFDK